MTKYLTLEGLEKLKKELDYLKKFKRKEIAERLKETASFGDLSENAAYQETKEAQAFLEGKILELEEITRRAKVIKKKKETSKVEIGSMVSVGFNNQEQRFQIVGTEEVNPRKGKISYQSPIGKALLNKPVGAIIKIKTPAGKVQYKILKID
jgi:transcription elongation factor GreA